MLLGIYPDGLVTPFNTSKPGELNNDQNSPFNVGLQISVSSSDLMSMVASVKNSVGMTYNLNSGNCVDWAMAVLTNGGIDLVSGMTRLTSTSSHGNTGSCQ